MKALAMTTEIYGQSQPTTKGEVITTLSVPLDAGNGTTQGTGLPAIERLQKTVEAHFPGLWPAVDLGLSVAATLLLEKNVNPVALIYVGKPSSGKTTVTTMFAGHEVTYLSDKFTPAAFVSSAANVARGELEKIDLLPKIRHKVLITPEMASTFRGKEEELTERFTTLIRVLDGQGLRVDSGSQGGRGYTGDYLFAWLGGTTPLDEKVWRVMAQLGSRLFFLVLDAGQEVTEEDLIADGERMPYMDRLAECKGLVHEVLTALFGSDPKTRVRSVAFQVHDLEIRRWLVRFARVLAKARGSRNRSDEGEGEGESPHRIYAVLNNLAHGHAIVHGRAKVTMADLPVTAEVTISSMPTALSRLLRATVHARVLTISGAMAVLRKKHHKTAENQMKKAAETGVFEFVESEGAEPAFLRFTEAREWCNSVEFEEMLGRCQNLGGVPDDVIFESSIASEEERAEEEGGDAHTPQKMTIDQ